MVPNVASRGRRQGRVRFSTWSSSSSSLWVGYTIGDNDDDNDDDEDDDDDDDDDATGCGPFDIVGR